MADINNTFWEGKHIFITGATGLLGSWLVAELVKLRANVTALMRDYVPNSLLITSGNIQKINVVNGNLENYHIIERALNEYEIDTVFHIGAQAIVSTANRSPLSTFESNIKGTWNVMEACRNSKLVKRIIVASSDKAYGTHAELPYTEDTPLRGEYPYDLSKSCADLIAQCYHKTYGLPVVITRCGNIYGGGDLNFNRIIPETIKAVLYNQQPIIRSDGTFIRDYIYVEDIVECYLLLAENIENEETKDKVVGNAFNISTSNKINVLDLVRLILKLMESDLNYKILNIVKGEIKSQYLSSKKINDVLKWQPKYDIEFGLKKTIEWYKKFFSEHE